MLFLQSFENLDVPLFLVEHSIFYNHTNLS